ncbi:Crp/Fnr family transcriptional regulator [bacterium]|nr:Crp/Fnr family transcriptional regulator [bacterium]
MSSIQIFKERFQGLFEDALMEEIIASASSKSFRTDDIIIDINDPIEALPFIMSGSIKVLTEDEDGKEMLLYYLESGETCAVTMNCCSHQSRSKIRAVAESECDILFIPTSKVENWMANYKSWRDFILETYDYRLHEMLRAIDSLAFHNMQERLYQYLRDKAMVKGSTSLEYTQSEIANDLHSSRVVISRMVKKLEEEGLIKHSRNNIELLQM